MLIGALFHNLVESFWKVHKDLTEEPSSMTSPFDSDREVLLESDTFFLMLQSELFPPFRAFQISVSFIWEFMSRKGPVVVKGMLDFVED